jgi:prepilin-type N-terminal cleavage/methylation domain-containing protein
MKNRGTVQFAQESGFTLVEILVAVTLVAMMAVGLWAALRISISSWARGTENIDASQRNRSILDLVRKQMGSTYGAVAPVDLLTGATAYPIFSGTETSVQFISLCSLRFHDNPGLTMVSYDVVQDSLGNYELVQKEARYLGLDPEKQDYFIDSNQLTITVFNSLESFKFEYFDPGTQTIGPQWVSTWDPRETQSLPAAISMTFVTKDSKAGTLARQMVVPIIAKPDNNSLNASDASGNRSPVSGSRRRRAYGQQNLR